jgi:hypothetical protein
MNPSAKAAGLSFQLSSPIARDGLLANRRRSDDTPHDGGALAGCTEVRPYSDCEYFTQRQFVRRNLASIRLSKTIAVCSGESQSALSVPMIPDYERLPMVNTRNVSDSYSPVNEEASSEQTR